MKLHQGTHLLVAEKEPHCHWCRGLCHPSRCPHSWSAFKPHAVKPELCKWPHLLAKGMSNAIALRSYKLNY